MSALLKLVFVLAVKFEILSGVQEDKVEESQDFRFKGSDWLYSKLKDVVWLGKDIVKRS